MVGKVNANLMGYLSDPIRLSASLTNLIPPIVNQAGVHPISYLKVGAINTTRGWVNTWAAIAVPSSLKGYSVNHMGIQLLKTYSTSA